MMGAAPCGPYNTCTPDTLIAMECLLGGIYVLHYRDEKPGERKTMKGRQPPSREVDSQAVHLRYIHILEHIIS